MAPFAASLSVGAIQAAPASVSFLGVPNPRIVDAN
jgi:hypothetical protein